MSVALLFVFSPTITVTKFALWTTEFVNNTTDIRLSIDGEITIKPGVDTLVLLEGINLWDEENVDQSFLSIGKIELSLDMLSVLNSPINIQKFVLSDVTIDAIHAEGEGSNIPDFEVLKLMQWIDGNISIIPPFIAQDVQLRHVLINVSDVENNLSGQLLLEEIDAGWGWNSPLTVYGEGLFLGSSSKGFGDKPITISMSADSMRHLGDQSLLWSSNTHIAADQGDISTTLSFAPSTDESILNDEAYLRVYRLNMEVKNLHYGELLTRLGFVEKLGIDSNITGHLGSEILLEGNVSEMNDPLLRSSGVIEVSVWPENQLAAAVDFWATNLLNVMLTGINSDSKINCAVARFNLSDGVLNSDVMVFDTSRLRVYGDGVLDLATTNIDFLIVPKAKQIQWVDKSVPVRLMGTLKNPEIEVKKMGLFKSVAKSVINFSIPMLPILINDTMESDGSKECLQSMQQRGGRLKD